MTALIRLKEPVTPQQDVVYVREDLQEIIVLVSKNLSLHYKFWLKNLVCDTKTNIKSVYFIFWIDAQFLMTRHYINL